MALARKTRSGIVVVMTWLMVLEREKRMME